MNLSDCFNINGSKCLNNSTCMMNTSLNISYCQCDLCHQGHLCETLIYKQNELNTDYIYFVIYLIGLCVGIINNGLVIELFIGSRRIRRTNSGIYLFIYCILSLIASILIVIMGAVDYYPNSLVNNSNDYKIFKCSISSIGYNTFIYLCIWFSAWITFEHALVLTNGNLNINDRRRSLVTVIVTILIAVASATPLVGSKCDWTNLPKLKILRGFFSWFYITAGIAIYVISTLITLVRFMDRIHRFKIQRRLRVKILAKLFRRHFFVFIPPIVYGISQIPYTIVYHQKPKGMSYFPCGISIQEYIFKVFVEVLMGVPFVLTWLLFVYPSRVYINEYYLKTWTGRRLANIILLLRTNNYITN